MIVRDACNNVAKYKASVLEVKVAANQMHDRCPIRLSESATRPKGTGIDRKRKPLYQPFLLFSARVRLTVSLSKLMKPRRLASRR
jgi:hypothetical protein